MVLITNIFKLLSKNYQQTKYKAISLSYFKTHYSEKANKYEDKFTYFHIYLLIKMFMTISLRFQAIID